jgi:hypothetical protein
MVLPSAYSGASKARPEHRHWVGLDFCAGKTMTQVNGFSRRLAGSRRQLAGNKYGIETRREKRRCVPHGQYSSDLPLPG